MSDNTPITDCPKEEKTVFIFGKTGVGKSLLINNILLNLQFPTLDEALASAKKFNPVIPFKGSYGEHDVSYGSDANERQVVGESRTLGPRKLRVTSNSWIFNIVDTPGLLDSSGEAMDKEHLDKITACMGQYKEIHAILVVLTTCDNTLNKWMKHVLHELLSCLGKTAVNNIHFLVTHVGVNMDTKNASDVVRKYIEEERTGITMSIFGFEADPFLYLMGRKKGILQQTADDDAYNRKIFARNQKELHRLFKIIGHSEPYNVKNIETLIVAKQIQSKVSDLKEIINGKYSTLEQGITALNETLNKLKSDEAKKQNDINRHKNNILEETKRKRDKAVKLFATWSLGGAAVAGACAVAPPAVFAAAPVKICFWAARLLPALAEVSVAEAVGALAATASGTGFTFVGALHGAYHYFRPVPDKETVKLEEELKDIKAKIDTNEEDKKAKHKEFDSECTNLQSLRLCINVYLEKHAITATDTVNSESEKSQTITGVSNPDDLLKRLKEMKDGKYFGKEIGSLLRKCNDLRVFDFPKGHIVIKSHMTFG